MRYAELHCKTNFTFLTGAAHADELAVRAKELGYAALAVTDRETLSGIVRAHLAAKECELPLIVGAEVHPVDGPPACLWATDRRAYGRLSQLLTVGRRRAEKGKCELRLGDIAEHHEGLLAGVIPGEVLPEDSALQTPKWHAYRDLFGDRAYLLAELSRGADDAARLERLQKLSKRLKLPLVAAGDVHYHTPERQVLQEVLTAIRLGTTVDQIGASRFANAQRHLRPLEDLESLFSAAPEAIRRTIEIADRCKFSLSELRYEYPEELAPPGSTPVSYLAELTWKGADQRYPAGVPPKVRTLIEYELRLIQELKYEAYFLTVWDLVRYARERGILCQGRGSAANSAVCFCLGVTSVDPDRADVLFERFVSKERNEAPDIDVDFEHERREEVLQYLYDKYGRERAGLTAVVITYRIRSAVRDAGKALGLSLDRVDALAKNIEGRVHEDRLALRCSDIGIDPESELGRRLIYVISQLCGFPRHLSQHVGGMVITQGPLCELAPIENAAMEGRTVIEWDKDDLDELGILKVDCLCLGMLSAIRKCFQMIDRHYRSDDQEPLSLANVPAEDPKVYDMICKADTIGVFQIESRAQMSMLPRLKPREYYDLVIEVAIVRPGPIQGQMVHPYLRRRSGEEAVTYPNGEIRAVLHKTLGVPLFQEQAMKLAVVAAGFTPGEADQLRRAMGAWRRPGIIDQFRIKLIKGMRERGLSEQFAQQVFNQIRGFGEYGFPESHAASFALLVYVSAWIKCYYPAAFAAGIINSQPMGFYAPAQLIRDARAHGVRVLPVDVNDSEWNCTLERLEDGELALRLGFRILQGMREATVESFVAERAARGAFQSLADFTQRTKASKTLITRLAEADVFSSLQMDRRAALWQALAEEQQPRQQPLFAGLDKDDEPHAALPPMPLAAQVFEDYRTAGLSLKSHPIAFHREALQRFQVMSCAALDQIGNGRQVRVGGLIILRQRPGTAKGITFVTMEDETGVANLVLRPEIWERYYSVARRSNAWIAHGKLEKRDTVIHVVVNRLEDLSESLAGFRVKSRDFR